MRRVILESPYQGNVQENEDYARACLRDCIQRNEAPLASHMLYTQPGVLRDTDPTEREMGINAGLSWTPYAEACVVYTDRGISGGMARGIAAAEAAKVPVEYRRLNI